MGPPSPPKPPKPKPDLELERTMAEENARRRSGRGFRSTIISDLAANAAQGGLKPTLGA